MTTTRQKPDIHFQQSGGMAIVQPLTKEGLNWVKTHLNFEKWQVVGETGVAVDHCAMNDLRQNAMNDGLTTE
jgi:hypothetical protein